VAAGQDALSNQERNALAVNKLRRVYSQDLHATLLDALGVLDQRSGMPFAHQLTGRSVLGVLDPREPVVVMSTSTGVWPDHDPVYGVMSGEAKLVREDGSGWRCYLLARDANELRPLASQSCLGLLHDAEQHYPQRGAR
jgi:hypothetical protein